MNNASKQTGGRGELTPCPLGADCPDGGRHYESTKVYREHARSAARGGDVDFNSAYRGLTFPGYGTLLVTQLPGGSASVSVPGKNPVTVGKDMAKALTERSTSDAPPFVQSTHTVASRVQRDLMDKDGFSLPVAYAAAFAAFLEADKASMDKLFDNDRTALSWVAERSALPDDEDEYEEAYTCDDVAREMWDRWSMRIESTNGYTDPETGKTTGKITLSAIVGGERNAAEFGINDEYDPHIGKSTLASAIESYVAAAVEAEDAASYIDYQMLEEGLLDTLLVLDEESGRDTSMWDNLSTKDEAAAFREQFDAASETMTERLDEFSADSKKLRGLLDLQ